MKHLISSFLVVYLISGLISSASAQKIKGLDIGFSLLAGQNKYNRKYYGQSVLPPGKVTEIKSNYLIGAGIRAENYVTSHVSTMFELAYTQIDVPTNTLCDCNYRGNIWLQDEKHHWGSFGTGIRYYFNPTSLIKVFADGTLRGNWFVASTIESDDIKKTSWSTYGYKRFAPNFELAIGAKWDRLALQFAFQSNIARTITRDAGEHDQVVHPFKTGIFSQQFFGMLSFTAFKIR
jgi:hypothetical protein